MSQYTDTRYIHCPHVGCDECQEMMENAGHCILVDNIADTHDGIPYRKVIAKCVHLEEFKTALKTLGISTESWP